eukprot:CAMPEP_0198254718 /NCGR_PEP_ID=MMETSP1447-20131203/4994_1 /TAXON_ID=420782 /ORGANISM="Chaetoceros dichaeta, Strain CCMP1751" /LENGTH=273 /DNA_ID=CAMNT_0043940889 /DNA_START=70 /DNA_END=891 /DNA_ORIENTATION=+
MITIMRNRFIFFASILCYNASAFSPTTTSLSSLHHTTRIAASTIRTTPCCNILPSVSNNNNHYHTKHTIVYNQIGITEDTNDNDDNNNKNTIEPQNRSSLRDILHPSKACDPLQMSPTSLAYIGDAVFELYARSRYVWPSRRTSELQTLVVGKVRAETQSILYRTLMRMNDNDGSGDGDGDDGDGGDITLTTMEKSICSRGRNAGSPSGGRKKGPKRLYGKKDKGSSDVGGPEVYQESTALEALIGYTYLTDEARCLELLEFLDGELDGMDDL